MQPQNNQQPSNDQPQIYPRSAEKVIQPLDPNLVGPSKTITSVQAQPSLNNGSSTASTYDPTADTSSYKVPSLDLRPPMEDDSIKRVAMKHKSLMVLAILGLLGTVFIIYQVIQINHAIQNAANNVNTGSAQIELYFIYASIVFNLIIYTYLLLAKDPHTVAIILKILLVLEFISVFGIFWGVTPTKGISLLIDGAYLLFIYIVLNLVKNP